MDYQLMRLEAVASTNTYLKQLINDGDSRLQAGLTVAAVAQTAGRGQKGNSWEADPGQNVTLSFLLQPRRIRPVEQFFISEAVALAVAETVDQFLPGRKAQPGGDKLRESQVPRVLREACFRYCGPAAPGPAAQVKWPNDIYVGDRKISGILIENTLCGSELLWSVAGIGLNVNQPEFRSDAPNPVALRQLHGGAELDRDAVERTLCEALCRYAERLDSEPDPLAWLHPLYMARLWRGEGEHPWLDAATGERFMASIASVAPTGHLTLRLPDSSTRTYAFKEVAALI